MAKGQLYPRAGAAAYQVDCDVNGEALIVGSFEADSEQAYLRSEVTCKPKLGRLPREITLPGNVLLVCDSSESLDAWLDGKGGDAINKLESKRHWVIASVVMVPVLLYLVFAFIMPWIAVRFADVIPQEAKFVASQHTLSAMDATILEPSGLPVTQQSSLQAHFHKVINDIRVNHDYFDIQFRKSSFTGPNAFALPDGTIVYTDDMITLAGEDLAILDAILLHEVGHVEQNHSMQMIAESLFTTLAVSYFFGDLTGAIEAFFGVGSTVLHNKFSQAHERAADDFALHQLSVTGRNPEDFARAMEKLSESLPEASETVENWLSTHPVMKERIEKARAFNQ